MIAGCLFGIQGLFVHHENFYIIDKMTKQIKGKGGKFPLGSCEKRKLDTPGISRHSPGFPAGLGAGMKSRVCGTGMTPILSCRT
jgi:hypothetical protein